MTTSAGNAEEQDLKNLVVHLVMATTCMLVGTMKEVTWDSLQDRFYRARIVNGKTKQIVSETEWVTPHWIRWRTTACGKNHRVEVKTGGGWVAVMRSNCHMCFGYGMWPDLDESTGALMPLTEYEAKKSDFLADPCPVCSSDNYYWFKMNEKYIVDEDKDFDTTMSVFAERVNNEVYAKIP